MNRFRTPAVVAGTWLAVTLAFAAAPERAAAQEKDCNAEYVACLTTLVSTQCIHDYVQCLGRLVFDY